LSIVTLITDFGTRDYYVGAMKGVLLGIAPSVQVVDVTHDIEPQDVAHAAFTLQQILYAYPRDTVHVVVVDPGVGSDRRIILGRYAGRYVIAPDNGLVTFVHGDGSPDILRILENRRYWNRTVSSTFHGRDVMAPVAAHLASGVSPDEFGPQTDRVELLPIPVRAECVGGCLTGCVLCVDRFGTLVTNIHRDQLAGLGDGGHVPDVSVEGEPIGPVRTTFSDVAVGMPVAFLGSADRLEIAVNRGRACDHFGGVGSSRIVVR
jgi:S-adenosylmethionine hydrolase